MSLGKAIYSRLTGDSAVAAIVSTRVYAEISTENIYPLITYSINRAYEDSLTPMRAKEFTALITLETQSYEQAQTLSAAVRSALDNQGGTWGGIDVKGFFLQSESQDVNAEGSNSEALYYEVAQEYKVWAAA